MAQPKYMDLVDKSTQAVLSAIEVYNKPDFKYREESFTILLINGWELLLKAKLLKENRGQLSILYVYQSVDGKRVKKLKKKVLRKSRSGNNITIGIGKCFDKLVEKDIRLDHSIKLNIQALTEIRNTAIHLNFLGDSTSLKVNEIGSASLQNYFNLIKDWFKVDLSDYNIFIMPMTLKHGYEMMSYSVSSQTEQIKSFLKYVNNIEIDHPFSEDSDYNISHRIQMKFTKSTDINALMVRRSNSPDAVEVIMTEDEVLSLYPLKYNDLTNKCRARYTNFSKNMRYHDILKRIKKNDKLYHKRKLDPLSINSSVLGTYSTNIFSELDKHYTTKK